MKVIIKPQYESQRELIASLPQTFDTVGETIFVKRNVVKRLTTSQGTWMVKRYKKPNLIQRLAYTFWRKSKAERAYLFADRLHEMGIDTPESIAYIECRHGLLFSYSYFLSAECTDLPLRPLLVEQERFNKPLARAFAAFLVEMHLKGFLHGDLNLDNILFHVDTEDNVHFTVIDTNRSRFTVAPSEQECLDNLKRITHRRELLQYIVEKYALLRGWNPEECVRQVLAALDRFEHRNDLKRKLFYR